MKKVKITKKDIYNGIIISSDLYNYSSIRYYIPDANGYGSGVYGWNYDVYTITDGFYSYDLIQGYRPPNGFRRLNTVEENKIKKFFDDNINMLIASQAYKTHLLCSFIIKIIRGVQND